MSIITGEILILIGKVVALVAVFIGFYLIAEERFEISTFRKRGDERGIDGRPLSLRRRLLEKITGGGFDDQLVEALLMIGSALKAGRNLDQAFELVAMSTPPPLCNEFRILVQERRLGVPMVEALTNMAKRVPSQDLRLAINATIFQQETGGNLEALYRQIVQTVSERKKMMGKILAGTAHARLSGNLIGGIPLFIAAGLIILKPDYIVPLLENPVGQIILLSAICMALFGLLLINRMTANIFPEPEDSIVNPDRKRIAPGSRWRLIRPICRVLGSIVSVFPWRLGSHNLEELSHILDAAGNPANFSAKEFLGAKLLSGIVFVSMSIILFSGLSWFTFIMSVIWFVVGFSMPEIYVARLIRRRQRNIEAELPYVLDLLSLALEAGLDLVGGLQRIVEKSRPTDIIVEFKNFLADIKLGRTLEEALNGMADRVQVLSFFTFVGSLLQAQKLGADIGPTLRAQAEQMRFQKMIMAEEKVNKLPVKLLFPLGFFVFPGIFVMILGPSLLYLIKSLSTVFH